MTSFRKDENLTGRRRLRATWRGKLVLQVEYRVASEAVPGVSYRWWRDARAQDVTTRDMYEITEERENRR